MPSDAVELQPVRSRRQHKAVRSQLLSIASLDRRSNAKKAFDRIVAEVENDLGGPAGLTAVQRALIEAFAATSILVNDQGARVVLGEPVDVATFAQLTSTMCRLASRIGIERIARDVTPTLDQYLRAKETAS